MNINSYFDKIYVLNLYKKVERREKTIERLDKFNINYNIFNGVDGSVMNLLWKKFNNDIFKNPNYLACALSHLSIYQDAVEKGYRKILILEDDNQINVNINHLFENINIPEWKDLLYLGYIPLNDDCSMWTYKTHFPINNTFLAKNLWGLFAYGITYELMIELLDVYNNTFPMELDRYFVNYIQPRNNSIGIAPQLFCCDEEIVSDNMGIKIENLKLRSVDTRFTSLDDYI